MTINSRLHYELEGVWVTHNLLGTSQEIAFRGYECAVLWPAHAEGFGLGGSSLRATKAGSSTATGDHLVEVKIVRVEVRGLSSDLTAAEFEDQRDLPENDVIVEMQRVALEASVVSDAFISDFVQRVRVTAGQFWLGSSTHRPPQVWMAHFVDADGLTIRMGGVQQPPDELIAGKPELSLEVSSVAAILAQLGRGDPIPIPESLIQEARYTLWASPHADPTMATFLAALAVESKAHETLRGIANDDQQDLVEYALKNPREVTVSAQNLVDKFMKSINEHSLREERKETFKGLLALIKSRNDIAHQGLRVSGEDAGTYVRTASEVFEWLSAISGDGTTPLIALAVPVTNSLVTTLSAT